MNILAQRSSTLRIGIVTHYMPPHSGGIETVAESLFSAYKAAGFEARWIASRVPEDLTSCEDGVIRVRCWNGLERWLGVPWPVWGAGGVKAVARLVQWADIIHVHDCLYIGSAMAVLLARRARKPVLLSQHNGFVEYRSALLTGIERLAYQTVGSAVLRNVSRLAFCNPAAEKFVTTLLRGRTAFARTIPLGIDTTRFRPPNPDERKKVRQALGLPDSGVVVLFVGRLVKKKGIDLFLEVSRRMPSYHFLIVGRGEIPGKSAGNITWLPFVPFERLPMVYQAADVFLLPSYDEGVPLTVLEAMATGVPVIMSEGEASRIALERQGGCLLAKGEPSSLCERVVGLLRNPNLAATIAARSRELAVRDWSLKAMEASYAELVRELARVTES